MGVRRILEILVVDIETGDIDAEKNSFVDLENCLICEIGIANLNLDSGDIKPVFGQTCKEDISPNPKSWVFDNTSLTCKQIAESNHFKEFKNELQEIFKDKPVTSWGHDFDLARLEHQSRGLVIPTKFWDSKRVLTNLIKIPFDDGTGYKFLKVTEAFQYFYPKKEWQQNHRAIDDAIIEADIIFQATKKWPILINKWKDFV